MVTFIDPQATDEGPSPDSVLAGLDSEQRTAVTAPVGVVVVRAGAGSGKTTVLTRRIAWRVASGTADIERTMAITFTRQAATEMRTRLARYHFDGRPLIGTFHAVARKLMLQNLEDQNRRPPVIINNRSSLLSECMGDDAKRGGVNDVLAAIDWAHTHMLSPAAAAAAMKDAGVKMPLDPARFTAVFTDYEKLKRKRGVIDLNDFLTAVIESAQRDPRFAESIRFQYRHISVDEAQDMNPLQYEFLKVLLPAHPDVFLVGDPNQAIYAFNGADRELFRYLPGIGNGAHVVTLPANYRCTPEIVQFAVDTLAKDHQTAEAISKRPSGSAVTLFRSETEEEELRIIRKQVLNAHAPDRRWSDIAVLVRINAYADTIRLNLVDAGIPVRSSRMGGAWARAVSDASALTGREELATWSADILDTGEYSPDDADYKVGLLVRQFLDDNRSGMVNGRMFGSWMVTSADIAEADGVEVLSFHAAKGREWPFVVVAGMDKQLMPLGNTRKAEARSEEARLAYVALTRAGDELVVTWTDNRRGRSSGPSPFLPRVTTHIPTPDAPPEEFRRIARARTEYEPVESAIRLWRARIARNKRVDPDGLLTFQHIRQLVRDVPDSEEAIAEITGVFFARRYGKELLAVINSAVGR